jgi:hypothetical protein
MFRLAFGEFMQLCNEVKSAAPEAEESSFALDVAAPVSPEIKNADSNAPINFDLNLRVFNLMPMPTFQLAARLQRKLQLGKTASL